MKQPAPESLYRQILRLTYPNILSNITVPLLMISDIAMAGRMAGGESIAAVTVGAAVTSFVVGQWSLLRMGTTGFTAQARGAGDVAALGRGLASGSLIALVVGLVLALASPLYVAPVASLFEQEGGALSLAAQDYLGYAFLGLPAALLLYVFNGWLVGMQQMKLVMSVSIASNVLNISYSYLLAFPLGLGVGGLALGTVLAQYSALVLLALGGWRREREVLRRLRLSDAWHPETILRYFHVGKHLMLRTLLLQSVMLSFVYIGGRMGSVTLAANGLLMQLFSLFSYFMDGLAYAAEALVGEAVGARDKRRLGEVIPAVVRLGAGVALCFALLYALIPEPLLALLTDKADVLARAAEEHLWIAVVPLASFLAFLGDGIMVGTTRSIDMSRAVLVGLVGYVLLYATTASWLGADALWLAFVSYLALRSGWVLRAARRLYA